MLLVDLAILFGIAAVFAVAAGAVGGGSIGRRLEKRRREKQGARNAEEERRRLDERCAVCNEAVDATVDLWERGEWWHRRCWRESVES